MTTKPGGDSANELRCGQYSCWSNSVAQNLAVHNGSTELSMYNPGVTHSFTQLQSTNNVRTCLFRLLSLLSLGEHENLFVR